MKYAFFTVPVGSEEAASELNAFCANRRIIAVEKHFVAEQGASYWAFCVTYLGMDAAKAGPKRTVDYKEELSEQEFSVFAVLRTVRKEIAEKGGVPAYAVFTNDQLASFVRNRAATKADMERVIGVGSAKLRNYADAFLPVLQQAYGAAQPLGDEIVDEADVH